MTKSKSSVEGAVWLASYPKSGNTRIRALVEAFKTRKPVQINSMEHTRGDLNWYHYHLVSARPLAETTLTEQLLIRNAALAHMLLQFQEKPQLVKTHHVYGEVSEVRLFPLAFGDRAIYVVRDPRSVVLSYANHFKCSAMEALGQMTNETQIIKDKHGLAHVLSRWDTHVRSWTMECPLTVKVVRYEDLWRASIVRDMLEFLGFTLTLDEARLAMGFASFELMQKQEQEEGFREAPDGVQFFKSGDEGSWEGRLEADVRKALEKEFGETMELFEYAV